MSRDYFHRWETACLTFISNKNNSPFIKKQSSTSFVCLVYRLWSLSNTESGEENMLYVFISWPYAKTKYRTWSDAVPPKALWLCRLGHLNIYDSFLMLVLTELKVRDVMSKRRHSHSNKLHLTVKHMNQKKKVSQCLKTQSLNLFMACMKDFESL